MSATTKSKNTPAATYQLLLGDCLERMKEIPDGSVDLVLTDPPYGTTACKWDAVIPFADMWREVRRVLKLNGAAVFTASQPFTSAIVMSNPSEFRHSWVWQKNRAANVLTARFGPMKRHEDVVVFGKKAPTYYPQLRKGKPYRAFKSATAKIGEVHGGQASVHKDNPEGLLQPISIIDFTLDRDRLHPTQKPVALMEYLIRTYTNEGETVLDFTMGSGTTGVAAMNTGRRFIGIERDETYFQIASDRIAACIPQAPAAVDTQSMKANRAKECSKPTATPSTRKPQLISSMQHLLTDPLAVWLVAA